jgi:hypothetical protein
MHTGVAMGPFGLFAQRLVETVDPPEQGVEVVKMLLQITEPADQSLS